MRLFYVSDGCRLIEQKGEQPGVDSPFLYEMFGFLT